MPIDVSREIERVFREEYGRAIAVLTRVFGSIDDAEEAVQDAFTEALSQWPTDGIPPHPSRWIVAVARNRAVDRIRRESSRAEREAQAFSLQTHVESEDHAVHDDCLRLIFTCCHPALALGAQVALSLRLLGGLTTEEIARAFLVPEATMAQRIVRAKSKIRDACIPYRSPDEADLPARVHAVLAVLYLIFNEGYAASSGKQLTRADLCKEAIRLARFVTNLLPEEWEARGLLALMLLSEARRETRTALNGDLVLLADQDRSRWDRDLIDEGLGIVRECLARPRPGPYQIQAAINAVHSVAPSAAETDWLQIVQFYDLLFCVTPSPVVALNRAVALAEIDGPAAGLTIIENLELDRYHPFHVARADFLRRLGRFRESAAAYDTAIELSVNSAEREFLRRRRGELDSVPTSDP